MPEAEIFTSDDYRDVYPPGIERHFWNIARNALIYRWLRPHVSADDLVLDVGCGTGLVVHDLVARGLNVQGVESGAAPVLPGVASRVQVETDLFELDESLKRQVKLIMLLDVIEHMRDRRGFIQRVQREFPQCRHLLLTVPARRELWSDYDEHWGHHLRYTRPALNAELESAGFKPGRTAYFFHWLYLASLLLGALGRPKPTHFSPIAPGSLAALAHRLLGLLTRLESRLVPGFVAGSSLISIASCPDSPRMHRQ